MKVAFYSNVSGKNGVTTNLSCISVICALQYQWTCSIIENHANINNIESAFVRYHDYHMVNEENYYFNHIGIEALVKKLHSNKEEANMIESAALKFLSNRIYYIPHCFNINKSVLEYQLNEVIKPLLDKMEEQSDIVFVDLEAKDNMTTPTILEEVDLVVVNLSQNQMILRNFFENYRSLIPKSIFLISKYDNQSIYNQKNIMRKYHIPKENIAVIPYNVELKDSLSEGKVIEFITRNFNCKENDTNFSFIKAIKFATGLIANGMKQELREVVSD